MLDIAVRSWTHRKFFEALGSQIASIGASAAEVVEDQDFGSMPLVVVSGEFGLTVHDWLATPLSPHARVRGRHAVAEGGGHWIS